MLSERYSHVCVVGFIAFLTMSLLACQAAITDATVDIDSTVTTAVAEALAIQPSHAAPEPSASVAAIVEATIEVTDLGSVGDGPSVSPSPTPAVSPTGSPSPSAVPVAAPTPTELPIPTLISRATPVPTPVPTPTHLPIVLPTSEPTSIPTPTPVPTPIPLSTLLPTQVPTLVPTARPIPSPAPTPESGLVGTGFKVYFIDVGQGDAALIVASNGESLLIDGGLSKTRLRTRLTSLGITDIDAVLATHPDADHIAGLVEAFNLFTVERFYWNGQTHTTQTFGNLKTAWEAEGSVITVSKMGDTIPLGDLNLQVLHPFSLATDKNVNSIVVSLTCGSVDVLFTGDAEVPSEANMIAAGVLSDIDVLKVGHHGSNSSTSDAFLSLVRPEIGIISAGLTNQYGHPHAGVKDRLAAAGTELIYTDTTDQDDTVLLTSDCQTYSFSRPTSGASPAPSPTPSPVATSIPTATSTSAPTSSPSPESPPTPIPAATSTPVPTPTPVPVGEMEIACIFFDGVVPSSESDEYVEIRNAGSDATDIGGWTLKDIADNSPTFHFPIWTVGAGDSIRVYTNEVHPEFGGFSFGRGGSIWANSSPDEAGLFDANGTLVSRKSYPPGC
jgi:competence protein ComEC